MTNGRSERFYDSRLERPGGGGFPSCSTELVRIPLNRSDPHGYYREIGVSPWATEDEIRTAVRCLYRDLHPDTSDRPDPERLQRVKLIAQVLLDPSSRIAYNKTPPGRRMLDPVYLSELSALDLSGIPAEEIEKILDPVPGQPSPAGEWYQKWYDYFSVDEDPLDMMRAQGWYRCLVAAAPLVGYRRRIKVMIHDGPPFFHPDTSVMAIPRPWVPSLALAFGLFVGAAGLRTYPRKPRHARTNVSIVTPRM